MRARQFSSWASNKFNRFVDSIDGDVVVAEAMVDKAVVGEAVVVNGAVIEEAVVHEAVVHDREYLEELKLKNYGILILNNFQNSFIILILLFFFFITSQVHTDSLFKRKVTKKTQVTYKKVTQSVM
jgi:hypothetical protein